MSVHSPRVVETDVVPKPRIADNAFVPIERSRALTEPIDGRIIEVSNDDRNIFQGEPGNPRVGWTAYVPQGSVAKGREIVTTGGVMRVGGDVVPRTAALMRVVVANLTEQDMVAVTAYLASLPPVKTSRPLTQPLGNATR